MNSLFYNLFDQQDMKQPNGSPFHNPNGAIQVAAQQAINMNALLSYAQDNNTVLNATATEKSTDTPLNKYAFNNDPMSFQGKETPALKQPQLMEASTKKKPIKALSAYNFFFKCEREKILHPECFHEEDYSDTKKAQLLQEHWHRDRTVKRRHRKTHGKIAFTTLSRMVSQRWKELNADKKSFYKDVAAKDLERYRRELKSSKMSSSVVTARSA
jgi:hypothetical protein